MKLHILFGQRKQSYKGEYCPEVLLCWDEFVLEENPEGFKKACEAHQTSLASSFSNFRIIQVNVDGDRIAKLLNEEPVISGTLVE